MALYTIQSIVFIIAYSCAIIFFISLGYKAVKKYIICKKVVKKYKPINLSDEQVEILAKHYKKGIN